MSIPPVADKTESLENVALSKKDERLNHDYRVLSPHVNEMLPLGIVIPSNQQRHKLPLDELRNLRYISVATCIAVSSIRL